jgi:hypothetical protein
MNGDDIRVHNITLLVPLVESAASCVDEVPDAVAMF